MNGEQIADIREDAQADVQMTTGAAPVQIEGTIDGYPFYFRSRWYCWTFAIGEPGEDIAGTTDAAGTVFFREGDYGPDTGFAYASYMPHEEAWRIVSECAAQFRQASEPGSSSPGGRGR